jgi:hypothetical protein
MFMIYLIFLMSAADSHELEEAKEDPNAAVLTMEVSWVSWASHGRFLS